MAVERQAVQPERLAALPLFADLSSVPKTSRTASLSLAGAAPPPANRRGGRGGSRC